MGERFIAYSMKQPTNKELAKAMKGNYSKDVRAIKDELSEMVAQYVSSMVAIAERTDRTEQQLSDELFDELNDVAIFATGARSQMNVDMRTREPVGLPSKERFPRFVKQLQSLAKAFYVMNGEKGLSTVQKKILYKIALDSVPRLRRAILQLMTKHKTVNTSAVAARFGFTTPVMRGELAQLSSLQIIQRIPGGGKGNEDAWKLLTRHRKFMSRFDNIKMQDDDLFEEDDVSPFDGEDVGEGDDPKVQAEKMANLKQGEREAWIGQIMSNNPNMEMEEAEGLWDKEQKQKAKEKTDPMDF